MKRLTQSEQAHIIERLEAYAKTHKLSQRSLFSALGISRNNLHSWRKNKSMMNHTTAFFINRFLNKEMK